MLKNYLKKLKQSGIERNIPNISEANAEYLGRILREKNPENILEIGTANGYSALSFWYYLRLTPTNQKSHLTPTPLPQGEGRENAGKPEVQGSGNVATFEKIWEQREIRENSGKQEVQGGGNISASMKIWEQREIRGDEKILKGAYSQVSDWKIFEGNDEVRRWAQIFTIEYAWNAHTEAIEHFKNCKVKNIFPMWWDAKCIIPVFQDHFFDVVYIDAMKKEYLDYLLLSLPKAKNDAIFIIDDVEKFAHKMQNLYDFLHAKNIEYALHKTDEDDSIMIIEAKNLKNQ